MKRMVVAFCLFMSICVHAADVRWNFALATQWGTGGVGVETTVRDGVCFSLFLDSQRDGGNVSIFDVTCNAATAVTFVSMAAEDLVSVSAFGNGKASLFSTEYSGSSGMMSVAQNQTFYLGFQLYELVEEMDPESGFRLDRGDSFYGWLEFFATNSGRVELRSSAIDLGGGSMIVGGGAAPIPEPSCGLLLLVGVAVLSLRRGRNPGHDDCLLVPSGMRYKDL